jgi:AAA15 family ATPase/GTPase
MSFIETIEIKNFKSIRHQKIEGCKRVNVFIGYPNVGKSNILEALALFSIKGNNLNFHSNIRIEELTTIFYNGNVEKNLEVRINGNKRWVGKMFKDFIRFEEQLIKEKDLFDENAPLLLQDTKDPGSFVVGSFFELRELRKENSPVKVVVQNFHSPKAIENRFNKFLNEIKKYVFKKDISHSDEIYDSLIYPYGNNLFTILSSHDSIKKQINELFQRYSLELLYDSRQRKFSILKRIESGIFSIPYDLVADTLQRLIFYRTAVLSSQESILLFEEPEAHMFPPYISKLTGDIMYDENKNQFFIATHSPYVLNDFISGLDINELALFIVTYDIVNGETIIQRMSDNEVNEAYQFGYDFFMNINQFIQKQEHE